MTDLGLHRYFGAMEGLACGDALGVGLESMVPGSFEPKNKMTGGGPFDLRPGDWTDDTSMALCLAESLIVCREFDPEDLMNRLLRWQTEGHLSSTGSCFDIGHGTLRALTWYACTGDPWAGVPKSESSGNGSLVRVPPVALAFARRPPDAITVAEASSRPTHSAQEALDACCYFTALLIGALHGVNREELLAVPGPYSPGPGLWRERPLTPRIAQIADGSFLDREPPEIKAGGNVADTLEAVLWAFSRADDFPSGALLAVNLGIDPNSTGAAYGALAGAYFGIDSIPAKWRYSLAQRPIIRGLARKLYDLAQTAPRFRSTAASD